MATEPRTAYGHLKGLRAHVATTARALRRADLHALAYQLDVFHEELGVCLADYEKLLKETPATSKPQPRRSSAKLARSRSPRKGQTDTDAENRS